MKLNALVRLSLTNMYRNKARLGLAGFGIAFGLTLFTFFMALKLGVSKVVLGKIFPVDQIDIIRPSNLVVDTLGILDGKPPSITEEEVEELRKVKGVKAVFPRLKLGFPFSAQGNTTIFGGSRNVAMELIGDGIPSSLVDDIGERKKYFRYLEPYSSKKLCKDSKDCPEDEYCEIDEKEGMEKDKRGECHKKVPVLVSLYLIEFYNSTVAPARNLPRVGEWLLDQVGGVEFWLELGKGYFLKSTGTKVEQKRYRARVVGISRHAIDIGITVPIEYAREWNQFYLGEEASKNYSSVSIILEDPSYLKELQKKVTELGLKIASRRSEQAALAINIITGLLLLVSLLVIFIAAVNIYQTFFLLVIIRGFEIALYRAVGASRIDIKFMVLAESAILGIISGITGTGVAWGIAKVVDYISNNYLPEFPFKPETYFDFPVWLIVLTISFGIIFSIIGAIGPAWKASRVDPVRSLY